jgi:hypothetical protein
VGLLLASGDTSSETLPMGALGAAEGILMRDFEGMFSRGVSRNAYENHLNAKGRLRGCPLLFNGRNQPFA